MVKPDSDDPNRFAVGATLWVGEVRRAIEAVRETEGPLLVRFEGVQDRNGAERLRGVEVSISEDDRRPLDDDEYWPDELVGMEVLDASGAVRGRVVAVIQPDTQDRIVVDTVEGRVEVPFVAPLIAGVDREKRVISLDDVEGLLTPR